MAACWNNGPQGQRGFQNQEVLYCEPVMGVMHNRNNRSKSIADDTDQTKEFFYILEIYSSTTETKDEHSKCLGLCVYQLPELLVFVHQGEVTVLEMICKSVHAT